MDIFDYICQVPKEYMDCRIVKMTIQPIVENAILHGIEPTGTYGEIRIGARKEGEDLCIYVEDNGAGMDEEELDGVLKDRGKKNKNFTGSKEGREAALKAADQLISRFQPVGEFIQAWGQMGAKDNYRFIIDCLLNLPLLYWASEETGQEKYRDVAEKHIRTALANVIREDDSTWHTFFMNPETGEPDHGATCQGYKDGSAWARGQAWGVYGTAIGYRYTRRPEYIEYFRRVTRYFLEHLPEDLCPYWDLSFGDGDEEEPRDSSSAVIAICGMLEMSRHLEAEEAAYYTSIAGKLMKAMIDRYSVKDKKESNGLLLHGTYSKKSPYNTCTPEGVDECVIWGDYFYMEAMKRFLDPDWIIYW